jgi:hypothetical protein
VGDKLIATDGASENDIDRSIDKDIESEKSSSPSEAMGACVV